MSFDTDSGGLFNAVGIAQIEAVHGVDPIHERTRIREFFAARLVAVLEDPERLHSDPTLAIQGRPDQFELPALNITTRNDPTSVYHKDAGGTRHELELGIDIHGAETNDVDVERLIDSVALGVETIVLAATGWPASIESVDLSGTERSFNSDGARRIGECRLSFTVTYTT